MTDGRTDGLTDKAVGVAVHATEKLILFTPQTESALDPGYRGRRGHEFFRHAHGAIRSFLHAAERRPRGGGGSRRGGFCRFQHLLAEIQRYRTLQVGWACRGCGWLSL